MISPSTRLNYYKRKEIQKAMINAAKDKEIAVQYGSKGFGKRPDVLRYPQDVLEFAKKGATSFHCSEELWYNPLQISSTLKRNQLDELRKGWDLVLDIDGKDFLFSQFAAHLVCEALKFHGTYFAVKFSGNKGFHIAVPFKAIPSKVQKKAVKDLFPEGPRKIAAYIQSMIENPLAAKLLDVGLSTLVEKSGLKKEQIVKNNTLDPFKLVDIDTILIASRHLYRMPFSLHEKSGLASIPIHSDEILTFDKTKAKPENVTVKPFLENDKAKEGEAKRLFVEAFDFQVKEDHTPRKDKEEYDDFESIQEAIPEAAFPPCIRKHVMKGMKDGRKRALFILINFLASCGW